MSQRQLVECPSCNRHAFADACTCPFCGATMGGHSCAPVAARARLGRAARMAAAASLLGMSACGYSSSYGTMGGLDADSARAAAEQAAANSTAGAADAAINPAANDGGPRDGG